MTHCTVYVAKTLSSDFGGWMMFIWWDYQFRLVFHGAFKHGQTQRWLTRAGTSQKLLYGLVWTCYTPWPIICKAEFWKKVDFFFENLMVVVSDCRFGLCWILCWIYYVTLSLPKKIRLKLRRDKKIKFPWKFETNPSWLKFCLIWDDHPRFA